MKDNDRKWLLHYRDAYLKIRVILCEYDWNTKLSEYDHTDVINSMEKIRKVIGE